MSCLPPHGFTKKQIHNIQKTLNRQFNCVNILIGSKIRENLDSEFVFRFLWKPVLWVYSIAHKLPNYIYISERNGGVFTQIIIKTKLIPQFYPKILAHQVLVWWATGQKCVLFSSSQTLKLSVPNGLNFFLRLEAVFVLF